MARRSNQKLKLLYILKILLENTQEGRGITLTQLSSQLAHYGIEAERKTLYSDLDALRLFGFDLKVVRDRSVRYYIGFRNFDEYHCRLLLDLVKDADMLSQSQRELLEKKLQGLRRGAVMDVLPYEQRFESPIRRGAGRIKIDIGRNLTLLSLAMEQDKKVFFNYYTINPQKQRILRHEGVPLAVSPWKIDFRRGRHMLVGYTEQAGIEFFDCDKMVDLRLFSPADGDMEAALREGRDEFAAYERCSSPKENICLRCHRTIAADVFDRFGMDVTVLARQDDLFDVAAKIEIDEKFFEWLFLCGANIRIISPQWVREKYLDELEARARANRE